MTRDEFNTTKWYKGMQVRVKKEPSNSYEVVDVDFENKEIGIYTKEDYLRMSYDEVELVEK